MRHYIGLLATASVVQLLGLGVQRGQVILEPNPSYRSAKNGHLADDKWRGGIS